MTVNAWEMHRMRLERVLAEMPAGFDVLRAEARAEGYRHIDRLADEWLAGTMRFDRDGEALIAAGLDRRLAGIGGITIDPSQPGALRMRRFYVRCSFRRAGIGRAIAVKLLAHARAFGHPVTVNAGAGSEPFWRSLGFVAETRNGHTHISSKLILWRFSDHKITQLAGYAGRQWRGGYNLRWN
jgi:GNAT superfamily N-acetyltransferase